MLARCARCQGTFTTDHYGRQTCPHCGSELLLADPNEPRPAAPAAPEGFAPPPPPGGGWAPLPPPGPPPPEPDLPSPFAERSTRGFFRSFFETWKLTALEPQRFFARVRIDQVGTAIFFGVLAAWVGGVVGGLLSLANRGQLDQARRSMEQLPPGMSWFSELMSRYLDLVASGGIVGVYLIATPLLTLLLMFLMAGVAHLFLLLFGGAGRGFGATLTVVGFSHGVDLLAAIPACGGLVALVWQLVILIVGLAAIHRTQVWKSAVAVLLPAILCCCCGPVSLGGLFAGIASRAGGGSADI